MKPQPKDALVALAQDYQFKYDLSEDEAQVAIRRDLREIRDELTPAQRRAAILRVEAIEVANRG